MLDYFHRAIPETTEQATEVFEFRVVRVHKTAMARQIHEALQIAKTDGALNAKDEYTRCVIPSLSVSNQDRSKVKQQTPAHNPTIGGLTDRKKIYGQTEPCADSLKKRPRRETDVEKMPPPPPPTPSNTTTTHSTQDKAASKDLDEILCHNTTMRTTVSSGQLWSMPPHTHL